MPDALHPAWRDYARRRRLVLLAVLSWLPFVHGLGRALARLTESATPGHLLLSVWLTACVGALVELLRFRCPFCGERFHLGLVDVNPFASRCIHCGFERWRDPQAGRVYRPGGEAARR